MTSEDELGGSFDKTVIGPSKRGSARPSEVTGSAPLGEPTVLLTERGAAGDEPASSQETVIIARPPDAKKAMPRQHGQRATVEGLFPEAEQGPGWPNPILAAVHPILVATARLRRGSPAGPYPKLRDDFAQAVEAATSALKRSGLREDDIRRTRLVLCEIIDDTMLGLGEEDAVSPSGTGMMLTFFQTRFTGTGFFETLNELLADPPAQRDILEFMHACLCLGFMGQYRGRQEADLERIRCDLRDALHGPSSGHGPRLSPLVAPERRAGGSWIRGLVITLGAATAAGAIYLGMWFVLDREASAVIARLASINSTAMATVDGASGNPGAGSASDAPY